MTPEAYAGESEHSQQVAFFMWISEAVRTMPELGLVFAVPNGGLRNKATAGRMVAEGARSGVPDIFVAIPRNPWHGFFIEMKKPAGGVVSPNQLSWRYKLESMGYRWTCCNTWDAARDELLAYLNPALTVRTNVGEISYARG